MATGILQAAFRGEGLTAPCTLALFVFICVRATSFVTIQAVDVELFTRLTHSVISLSVVSLESLVYHGLPLRESFRFHALHAAMDMPTQ